MNGARKMLFITLLAIVGFGLAPVVVLPLPYEGLDWVDVGELTYYATPAATVTSTPTYTPTPPTPDPGGTPTAPPTGVTLVYFRAMPLTDEVVLSWGTASESDELGFHLDRGETVGGPFNRVNRALIPSRGGPVSGADYTYRDSPGSGRHYYVLQVVHADGRIEEHGPVEAEVGERATGAEVYLPAIAAGR